MIDKRDLETPKRTSRNRVRNTFGMLPGFMRNTPKDILPQMWPLFKKYQMGTSILPQKYREMMMLAEAATTKCLYCQTYHKEIAKMYGASVEELNELAVIIGQTSFGAMCYIPKIMTMIPL
jgi:AhpD family alkylhydroperoxidase